MSKNITCPEIGNCMNAWNCGFCHEVESTDQYLACPGYKPKTNK